MSARVLLVRHGETEWNARGLIQGHSDIALSARGLEQAGHLARRLASESPEDMPARIVCSDLRRAVQTAEVVAAVVGIPVTLDRGLREQCFGAWEGLHVRDVAERFPEEAEPFVGLLPGHPPPGGESREEVRDRVVAALERHAPAPGDRPTLLISHGGVLQSLVYAVLGLPVLAPRRLSLANAALTLLERRAGVWLLSRLNDTAHLDGPAEAPPST